MSGLIDRALETKENINEFSIRDELVDKIRSVCEASGIHILVCGDAYNENELPTVRLGVGYESIVESLYGKEVRDSMVWLRPN